MNLVKTYIDKSPIQGIGLFAGEFIPKHSLLWKLDYPDILLSDWEVDSIKKDENKFKWNYLKKYIYKTSNGDWILCSDDARYTNHSNNPNTIVYIEDQYSLRDIQVGEEITCDYHSLDKDFTEEEFNEQ